MKLSPYFNDLSKSYAFEIEDLTYDSAGKDVLKSRLRVKREQFAALLPMIEFEPVMVAPAFHGAFHFSDKALLEKLVSSKPDSFPSWKQLAPTIRMDAGIDRLAQQALKAEGGETFMLIAAGLEFILSGLGAAATAGHVEHSPESKQDTGGAKEYGDEEIGEFDESDDLGESGEDYLNEQGFDRRN